METLFSLNGLLSALAGVSFPYLAEWMKNKLNITSAKTIMILLSILGVLVAWGGDWAFSTWFGSVALTAEQIVALGAGLTGPVAALVYKTDFFKVKTQ